MQPTPVFLPGKSHGQRNLANFRPWGRKESDTTEETEHAHTKALYKESPVTEQLHFHKNNRL